MTDREKAIKTAAALLRLAARGGTVHEAATAAAKAQEVMDRWELTHAMVREENEEKPDAGPITSFADAPEGWLDVMSQWKHWRWVVANGLARLHGCFCFQSRRAAAGMTSSEARACEIVGRPGDVETVRYFYQWLTREITHLTDTHGKGMGGVWRRNFAEGAAGEVIERLKQQRQQTADRVRAEVTSSTALVRLDQALARWGDDLKQSSALAEVRYKLRTSKIGRRQHEPSAREAGRAAARNIDLAGGKARLGTGARRQIEGAS